ncbi:DNA repair protein RadA [Thiovibrio frasassiensis]|uniref:DNA repair protein RadA n=1 Tax=Thiovibrio frasassiensis TaxID=2984131 RepID=A0A9X4MH80_9BACT|nr:DNA repair protein RadA [Thiovibrio frasassiensis]MDG4475795.1 DNA repair protein RadA [Thiovibrio frasassiensis]
MAKEKISYVCSVCSGVFSKWAGQCDGCGAWDTLAEQQAAAGVAGRFQGYSGSLAKVQTMAEVGKDELVRFSTGMGELDRVLGGGLVPGSVVLIGGDPGVGKSTGLLQVCCNLSLTRKCLYVTGEESLQQIAMRARRLGLPDQALLLLAETRVEDICATALKEQPEVVVIDSIQTMQVADSQSAPGSVSQVRESAALLTQFAKQTGIAIFLVGHVTKSGDLAGPRVLEHIIDVVCYIEGGGDSRFRVMRAVKNRYGAVNELGVFAMTDKGLREISNPSAIFLSRHAEPMPGSVVMAIWEGSRPLLVEMQALVDDSHSENPRRVTVGLEQNRLAMLLAVLHRHGSIATYGQDVFINVAGGVRVSETSADLALLLAVFSSLKNKPLPVELVVFGEVGLSGEIRPVPSGQERLREAAKHGFKQAIVPLANVPKGGVAGMEIIGVRKLAEAIAAVR